jgi:hypothetical protein
MAGLKVVIHRRSDPLIQEVTDCVRSH